MFTCGPSFFNLAASVGAAAISARYWRFFMTSTLQPYRVTVGEIEFSLAGAAVSAVGKTYAESSAYAGHETHFAFDGLNDGNCWLSGDATTPQWISVDFGVDVLVDQIAVLMSTTFINGPRDFLIQTSPDNSDWTTQKTVIGATYSLPGSGNTYSLP